MVLIESAEVPKVGGLFSAQHVCLGCHCFYVSADSILFRELFLSWTDFGKDDVQGQDQKLGWASTMRGMATAVSVRPISNVQTISQAAPSPIIIIPNTLVCSASCGCCYSSSSLTWPLRFPPTGTRRFLVLAMHSTLLSLKMVVGFAQVFWRETTAVRVIVLLLSMYDIIRRG